MSSSESPSNPALPEHVAVFLRLRSVLGDPARRGRDARRRAASRRRSSEDESTRPFGRGRDPRGMGEVLDSLTTTLGWESPIARAELMGGWSTLVGEENAAHSMPVGIEAGVLTVRCDSSAWAQQLRLMRAQIVTRIVEQHPAAGVETIHVMGPDVPSWKKGPRSVPGRGPRDTYG